MADYSDKLIPPWSQFSPLETAAAAIVDEIEKGSSCRRPKEANTKKNLIVTESMKKERDRRGKMAQNYDLLQSMLPTLTLLPKANREMILAETTTYIQSLEEEIKRLEELKKNSSSDQAKLLKGKIHLFDSDRNSSINVTVSSNVAFFGIQSVNRPRLVTDIFMVFDYHKAEVLAANVAVNQKQLTLTLTAVVNGNGENTIEKIKRDILNL
ncbi:hypothetical protein CCACVL1_28410 [Corchorus capsularis]|uniref:BHLH domain-containing protein n=1 Tax=Corchorus capsularis TaxID=210143 RepID=A0A1R3G6K0_COCAP|nr:hypothetical protein CCACVL1_28410 [Corchorus capsularis]